MRVGLDKLREPEVEQLDEVRLAAADREVDVARAQITMDVADRVRLHQRLADLDQDVRGALDRERLLHREHVIERVAFEQLHREVQPAVERAPEVVDLDDVLVIDLGDRGRLAPEPLDREVVARELGVEHLDRDLAAQRDVLRAIDRAGAALPDQLLDLEPLAEQLADERIARRVTQLGAPAVRAEQRALGVRVAAATAGDQGRGHVMSGHKSPDGRRVEHSAWRGRELVSKSYGFSDFLSATSSASVKTPLVARSWQRAAKRASRSGATSATKGIWVVTEISFSVS